MSRESIEELIKRKLALDAEQFEIDEKLSALPPEHLWVVSHDMTNDPIELTPQQENVKASFLALNARKLLVQSQIYRAQLFGLRHTKSIFPSLCLTCFLNHAESPMVEIESKVGSGIRTFKCGNPPCGYELSVDETIPQPGSV